MLWFYLTTIYLTTDLIVKTHNNTRMEMKNVKYNMNFLNFS